MLRWWHALSKPTNPDLYIHHHLGLGDMIHCNGLVRHLLEGLEKPRKVRVFCKSRYRAMTEWMYRDEPRIGVVPIDEQKRERREVERVLREHGVPRSRFLSVGHREYERLLKVNPELYCDQFFYLQLGVPYEYRFSKCFWERDYKEEERVYQRLAPAGDYAFVHDDPTRGFVIPREGINLPIVRNDTSISIFHLGLLLERARQVHCMESSIRCMIESLDMQHVDLFLHTFRGDPKSATRHAWRKVAPHQRRLAS